MNPESEYIGSMALKPFLYMAILTLPFVPMSIKTPILTVYINSDPNKLLSTRLSWRLRNPRKIGFRDQCPIEMKIFVPQDQLFSNNQGAITSSSELQAHLFLIFENFNFHIKISILQLENQNLSQ